MRVSQEKVRLFHEKHHYLTPDEPQLLDATDATHRHDLISEELEEYYDAALSGDLVQVADALADLLYVVLGTAVAHGIEIAPVFDEVHRSNMTKDALDPVTRKGGKGPNYEPPVIGPILLAQAPSFRRVEVE